MVSDSLGKSRSFAPAPSRLRGQLAGSSRLTLVDEAGLFRGLKFRVLGDARSQNLRSALAKCGAAWADDGPEDEVDFVIVRLASGGKLFQEADLSLKPKFRTECWVEQCIFEERICSPEEHVCFRPLRINVPIPGMQSTPSHEC
jgi:DNA replication regulator DPB11